MLDPRRITRVGAVGTAAPSDDVAATIEHGKGMAVLERAQAALLERDVRFDVNGGASPPPALAEAGVVELVAGWLRPRSPPERLPRSSRPRPRHHSAVPRRIAILFCAPHAPPRSGPRS